MSFIAFIQIMPSCTSFILVLLCLGTIQIQSSTVSRTSRINEPFTNNIVLASSLLPREIWEQCFEFLGNSTDYGRFRSISRLHDSICRSAFRRKFDFFHIIFTETKRQQRIRSWSDIEGKIPFNPAMHPSWQWMGDSVTALIALYKFHSHSNNPIVCGVSYSGTPFVSFYLIDGEGIYETLLVCVLGRSRPRLGTVFIYNEFGIPSLLQSDSFGIAELDWLLDGQEIQLQHTEGWLARHWKLINPQKEELVVHGNWWICMVVVLIIILIATVSIVGLSSS